MNEVRVRFAPSPTGPLHIGGVRTALYNYLFAKKHNGKFILRIEDTDQQRFVEGAEEYIVDSLKWCGINYDEGIGIGGIFAPYKQSERKEIYKKYAFWLVEKQAAYYAFDTPEELELIRKKLELEKKVFQYDVHTRKYLKNSLTFSKEETENWLKTNKPYVIRFKIPENREIVIKDIIRGEIRVNTNTLDDKVLFKSDGLPTYHLANIIDDHLMKITHVIRGEEWLPSLPLHYLLYEAFEWFDTMPQFAHLPLILKPDGKGKLSKRDGDKGGFPVFPCNWKSPDGEIFLGFREWGVLPEAFINILALLGWNSGTEQEIFSIEDLIQQFDLNKVNKSGARFDPEKAKWFNQQYIRKKSNKELAELLKPELLQKGYNIDENKLLTIIELLKDRITFVTDILNEGEYFFKPPEKYDENVIKKKVKSESYKYIKEFAEEIDKCNFKTEVEIEKILHHYAESRNLPLGEIMIPLRISLVATTKGPSLPKIMETLGKDEVKQRILRFLESVSY